VEKLNLEVEGKDNWRRKMNSRSRRIGQHQGTGCEKRNIRNRRKGIVKD
jgi:hypothetical protein